MRNETSLCLLSRFYDRCQHQVHVKDVYKFWKDKFRKSNVPEPNESIEHILAFNLGSTKITDVHENINKQLKEYEIENINQMCELRLKRMPVQYILKEWDFRDMTLKMKPPVFIPRPETEMLIDIILKDCERTKPYKILEIGCGTGAISLTLLNSLKNSRVVAVDRNPAACELTMENSKIHKLNDRIKVVETTVGRNDKFSEFEDFDIIVSNPPYVPSGDLKKIEPEIELYEDLNALDGGEDGLDLIKIILDLSAEKLIAGGKLYMETDRTHPELIEKLICNDYRERLEYVEKRKDFLDNDRFVKIERI